jgi:hypothetical protein
MRKLILFCLFFLLTRTAFAQNEIGPEGHKLVWVFMVLLLIVLAFYFLFTKIKSKIGNSNPFFRVRKVKIEFKKDRLYYPDSLTMVVKNTGNVDVDLDQPLLIFDNFWMKRKFKIKGTGMHSFYPLYLEKGKPHSIQIDLNRFYDHDKTLKKFPKAQIVIKDVQGKKLGSRSVYLRKTLFKF